MVAPVSVTLFAERSDHPLVSSVELTVAAPARTTAGPSAVSRLARATTSRRGTGRDMPGLPLRWTLGRFPNYQPRDPKPSPGGKSRPGYPVALGAGNSRVLEGGR